MVEKKNCFCVDNGHRVRGHKKRVKAEKKQTFIQYANRMALTATSTYDFGTECIVVKYTYFGVPTHLKEIYTICLR